MSSTPQAVVEALLQAGDAMARQALLIPRDEDFYVAVAGLLKEEVDRERLRDPRAAMRPAEIAALVADFAAIPRCRALAAWARANVLVHQGSYAECLRLYEEAAHFFAAAGAEVEAARLTTNRAWVLKNLGRYEEGVQAAQAALDVLRRHPPSPFLASTLNGVATLQRLAGRHDEALATFAEAEAVYAGLGDPVQLARLRINKANLLRNLDRFDEAIALLEGARAVLVEQERSLEVARADLNLGITHTRLGRYDEALAALDRAEKGFAALDNRMEAAVVALHRADLYADFCLYEELLQTSTDDWELFTERQMQWHAARAALQKARAWRRLGHAAQAEEVLAEAQAAFARLGDPVWERLAGLERAAMWCDGEEWARALPLAIEASAFLHERSMPIRAAGASLLAAKCLLALARLDEAATRYGEVLDVTQALDVPPLLYRAYHGLGQVAERQGRLHEASEQLRRAVETVEGLRQRLRIEDLRLAFLEDKLQVYSDLVLLCLRLGREEDAFAYVERAKSGALVDLLVASLSRPPPAWGAADAGLLARLARLREQLNWQYGKLEEEDDGERGPGADPPEAEVWQRIVSLERETTRAWRELQQAQPLYAALGRPELHTAEAVRACLRGDEVLVQYYVAGEQIHAFVVDADGLRASLPLACTAAGIRDSLGALDSSLWPAARFERDYVNDTLLPLSQQQLRWLYCDLLGPLRPLLAGARRLLIAPDGPLFRVPFHALYDGEGYLLEQAEVAYVPSAGALRLCQENQRRLGREQRAERPRALLVGYARGDRLPFIHQEIETVARAIPGARVLVEEQATRARLQEQAGRSALLHLATHAVYRGDNPLFSALQLAGGDWLRVMDLYSLPLNGALVALSGCETGRHRLLGGDLLGLARGFFCAGASALVASLWPVDDAAAAATMAQFYARLVAGETAAGALRGAQQALRNLKVEREGRRVRPYAHPFYWAPFCLLGAPDWRFVAK
jgi:CHAT domain-containing protein/tetratricopeptide (TPR) repeat protein